jgi:hypothetical protein
MSNLNLIDYDLDQKPKGFDHNIEAAKLKQIENNVELKRANMVTIILLSNFSSGKEELKN